jgi:hypothetical protein
MKSRALLIDENLSPRLVAQLCIETLNRIRVSQYKLQEFCCAPAAYNQPDHLGRGTPQEAQAAEIVELQKLPYSRSGPAVHLSPMKGYFALSCFAHVASLGAPHPAITIRSGGLVGQDMCCAIGWDMVVKDGSQRKPFQY